MVIVFAPTRSGIGPAVHREVPCARSVFPVESDHVTSATATLSVAVPLSVAVLAEVATLVVAGDRIANFGGTVSFAVA